MKARTWRGVALAALMVLPAVGAAAGELTPSELTTVQKQQFTTKNFPLVSGVVLPELSLAYETYGTLARDGRNAVLVTHGFTKAFMAQLAQPAS
ncbi:MAG: hypothetical protein JO021_08090 [Alphaproteobacteria bacterium]|nr:hypothetical protein [Alphaproteobacteria bacterium]